LRREYLDEWIFSRSQQVGKKLIASFKKSDCAWIQLIQKSNIRPWAYFVGKCLSQLAKLFLTQLSINRGMV